MSDLVKQIEELTREEALEAAQYLSAALGASAEKASAEQAALQPLTEQPYAHLEDIEGLARILLLSAAAVPEYEEAVRKAVEGAGGKQFILGGAEIVVLSSLALLALQTVLTKGKTSEETVMTITEEKGKTIVKVQKSVRYGVSEKLRDILKGYFGVK
jgi:hypothetical protein